MYQTSYTYKRICATRYVFTSVGGNQIDKVVDFDLIEIKNSYNLGFGDLQPDGSVDDLIHSNNGDLTRVLKTVIDIIKDFTTHRPEATINFLGSTKERMKLYTRILKRYYPAFSQEFEIHAFVKSEGCMKEIPFDPQSDHEYEVFLIKRIQ